MNARNLTHALCKPVKDLNVDKDNADCEVGDADNDKDYNSDYECMTTKIWVVTFGNTLVFFDFALRQRKSQLKTESKEAKI